LSNNLPDKNKTENSKVNKIEIEIKLFFSNQT